MLLVTTRGTESRCERCCMVHKGVGYVKRMFFALPLPSGDVGQVAGIRLAMFCHTQLLIPEPFTYTDALPSLCPGRPVSGMSLSNTVPSHGLLGVNSMCYLSMGSLLPANDFIHLILF